jgi:hypothetical protein
MSRERLQQLLGVDASELGELAALDEAALAQLVEDIEAARRHQAAELREHMQAALAQLPWVLRAPIRRLFGLG